MFEMEKVWIGVCKSIVGVISELSATYLFKPPSASANNISDLSEEHQRDMKDLSHGDWWKVRKRTSKIQIQMVRF